MKHKSIFLLVLMVLIITACVPFSSQVATPEAPVGMPNPASQYCTDQGGELDITGEILAQDQTSPFDISTLTQAVVLNYTPPDTELVEIAGSAIHRRPFICASRITFRNACLSGAFKS